MSGGILSIYIDEEELLAMPVDQTKVLQIDDRNFTIVDSEFFYDVCRKAGLNCVPFKKKTENKT